MATEDRWHDFAKEKPSEDMEGRDFIVSNGYSDTLSMWCGGYWENEPFMGNKLCDEVVRWKGYLTPEEEKANEATRTELKADKTFVFGEECEAYKKSDVDELLAEKEAAIEELKQKLEDAKATAYTESVDVGMENHKLKRALWMARATIAHSTKYKYHRLSCKAEIDPQPHGWSCYINGEVYRTGKMNRKLEPHYWIEIWEEVERKCRDKAEEYK